MIEQPCDARENRSIRPEADVGYRIVARCVLVSSAGHGRDRAGRRGVLRPGARPDKVPLQSCSFTHAYKDPHDHSAPSARCRLRQHGRQPRPRVPQDAGVRDRRAGQPRPGYTRGAQHGTGRAGPSSATTTPPSPPRSPTSSASTPIRRRTRPMRRPPSTPAATFSARSRLPRPSRRRRRLSTPRVANNRKLVIGYILRVHPAWTRFIELARTLGKPLVMRMNLNQQSHGAAWTLHRNLMDSMSPIVDCGVHYVDVMCQMTGARPVSVSAVGARLTRRTQARHVQLRPAPGHVRRRVGRAGTRRAGGR